MVHLSKAMRAITHFGICLAFIFAKKPMDLKVLITFNIIEKQ